MDDLPITCRGATVRVLKLVISVAEELARLIEIDLEANIAVHKGAVVASSAPLARPLTSALGKTGGKLQAVATNLGCDFTAGKSFGCYGAAAKRK
eukprot:9416109-Pyramimonas_sp.AAC.1